MTTESNTIAPAAKPKAKAKGKAKSKAAKPTRTDSKQARFIAAMRTARGISITEAAKQFDWQPHTVRGAVAGALKRKLKLKVTAEQDEKRGTVYRLPKN
jgi:DNA-binding MarR family transcriptional regulator